MKQRVSAMLLSVVVLTAAANLAAAQNPAGATATAGLSAGDQEQIDQLRKGLVQAFNARDIDGMLRFLQPDAVVIWQNGEINRGLEAVRQFYSRMIVQGTVKSVTFDPAIEGRVCQESTCISFGNLQDEFTLNDGTVLPLHSRFSATLIKTGGTWKVASFHASANVFDNPVVRQAAHKVGMYAGGGGLLLGLIFGFLLFRRSKARPASTL